MSWTGANNLRREGGKGVRMKRISKVVVWSGILSLACLLNLRPAGSGQTGALPGVVTATNLSTTTACAEEDNINVPVGGEVKTFVIEAMHPAYALGIYFCVPDVTNCPVS